MTTVGIAGATGRLGCAVIGELSIAPDLYLIAAVARNAGVTIPGHPGIVTTSAWSSDSIPDVILDVSVPEGTEAALAFAREQGRPFITGVTGLSDTIVNQLREASTEIPVLTAANFSLGVTALIRLLPLVSSALATYDVAMVDLHHKAKRDAPSGTGKLLLNALNSGRAGSNLLEPDTIQSIRIGGNPGEHTITFASMGEEVSIRHRALSRACFACGAISAIRWISDKPLGLYEMGDLLP